MSDVPHIEPFAPDALHRGDPHRYEQRVRMEVDVKPSFQAICGALVPQGVHTIDVPESQVPTVEALVETDRDGLIRAEKHCELAEKEWRRDNGPTTKSTNSPQRSFREINKRDELPLRSARVVKRGLPAPLTDEERRTAAVVGRIRSEEAPPPRATSAEPTSPETDPAPKAPKGSKG